MRGTQRDNKLQHGHTQQNMNSTVITCVHTCHLWGSPTGGTGWRGSKVWSAARRVRAGQVWCRGTARVG